MSTLILLAALVLSLPIFSYIGRRGRAKDSNFMKTYGANLGLTYSPKADPKSVSGALYAPGGSIYDVVSGSINNHPIRIFTLSDGKIESPTVEYTLNSQSPHILVMPILTGGVFGVHPLAADAKLEFEGEFSTYFVVSVSKGYEQEAYQIFTLDFLQKLLGMRKMLEGNWIIDIFGSKLYVSAVFDSNSKEDIDSLRNIADVASEHIGPKLQSMKVDIEELKKYFH